MNGLARFFRLGAADADRRVAAALAPLPAEAADRHLKSSRVVGAIDRAMLRLSGWWEASEAARVLSSARDGMTGAAFAGRDHAIAHVMVIAVISHVALMLIQGPRPGWFWLIIPALVSAFAGLLLAGSQSSRSAD